jgi:hypothetical protein
LRAGLLELDAKGDRQIANPKQAIELGDQHSDKGLGVACGVFEVVNLLARVVELALHPIDLTLQPLGLFAVGQGRGGAGRRRSSAAVLPVRCGGGFRGRGEFRRHCIRLTCTVTSSHRIPVKISIFMV